MVNLRNPFPSGTAKRETSVATKVGAISLDQNFIDFKTQFPVTIL